MDIDDIKSFAKTEKEMETQIQTIRTYCQDVGMKFDTEKCAMLIIKNGKRDTRKKIKLPNQESLKMSREMENFKYLEILDANTI